MAPKISRKDKLSERATSLEILDRLKSGDKFTSRCERFNKNESTVRTVRENESKIIARASAGASSSFKEILPYKRSFMNMNRKNIV